MIAVESHYLVRAKFKDIYQYMISDKTHDNNYVYKSYGLVTHRTRVEIAISLNKYIHLDALNKIRKIVQLNDKMNYAVPYLGPRFFTKKFSEFEPGEIFFPTSDDEIREFNKGNNSCMLIILESNYNSDHDSELCEYLINNSLNKKSHFKFNDLVELENSSETIGRILNFLNISYMSYSDDNKDVNKKRTIRERFQGYVRADYNYLRDLKEGGDKKGGDIVKAIDNESKFRLFSDLS